MEEKTFIEQAERFREDVRDYYGKRLRGSSDLKTGACSCSASPCEEAAGVIPLIDGEILDRFYGCGSPIPPLLEGMTVLDLGCGTGRDAFIASKLVGPDGRSLRHLFRRSRLIGVPGGILRLRQFLSLQPVLHRRGLSRRLRRALRGLRR